MRRYIIKRLLLIIPILIGVSFIVYGILSMTPGDPGTSILGSSATQEQIDALNHDLGYDRPFVVRYVDYMYNLIFRMDMGESYRSGTAVWDDIMKKLLYRSALRSTACCALR